MVVIIGLLCLIVGLLAGYMSGAGKAKKEWQSHTDELLDARQKAYDDMLAAQQAKFDETIAKVTAQMKSATEDMLKRRQEEFAASSNTSIGQIVNPLKDTIDKMKEAMKENTLKQTSISSEIKTQAENMMRQSAAAKESTDELTRVFRHAGRVQGNWGEIILDELLESQGLTKGVHYDIQSSIRDASGDVVRTENDRSMRPDVILHLDQKRDVIIDSKVSLTAFMDYVNAQDEDDRQKFLKAHVESIRKHVKELAGKDYSSYVKPPKVRMDYVIMFVPNTGALWAAVGAQPDLWRNAMEKNVYIADEQTLFAALRIYVIDNLRDMEEDFGIIPFPKYAADQEAYYTHVDGHAPLMILPKTLANPENAGIVMEALAYESSRSMVPAVYDIVLQSKYARDEASQRMLDLILEGRVYTLGYIYDDWKGMQWTLQSLMNSKSNNYASFYKSHEKTAQKQLQLVIDSYEAVENGG